MSNEHIGARIRAERHLRDLTQRQLADRAHISLSLLKKVEQGTRAATPALVAAGARALRIDQTVLTGQPYRTGDQRDDAVHDLIPELRREIGSYGLPPDDDTPGVQLAELAARVAETSDMVHGVQYVRLGTALPALLADLRSASWSTTGTDRATVMSWTVAAYDSAKRLAYDLGYADLGLHTVTLEERAAVETGDPLAVAVTQAVRAWSLTGAGAFDAARRVLARGLADLDSLLPAATLPTWSVWGFLHLQAALVDARAGDAARTWEHYDAAQYAAAQLDGDRDDYGLAFGPANTAIWGVGLAVELQQGVEAIDRAQRVTLPAYLPRARVGHHWMDVARAHLLAGTPRAALDALIVARRVAPQQVRYHPMARESVYAVGRTEQRSSEALRSLASWMGIRD